jgi:hypothetical protein
MIIQHIAAVVLILFAAATTVAQECDKQYDSTFALLQDVVFEAKGCTSVTCHVGPAAAGGLDLSEGISYDQLVDQPVESVATAPSSSLKRVVPVSKANSLLWLNLAAAVLPDEWQAPLRPMPQGGFAPLTFDELELVRMWIEYGATRNGVVPGAAELVDACSGPPGRLEVEPLQPPAPEDGVQLQAPRQVLPPLSERETCFVSYYDLRGKVPAESLTADGTRFRYRSVEPRQDPLSHHAVVFVYEGSAGIDSPVWGSFACRGGAMDGAACNPRDTEFCGADSACGSQPVNSLACIGFGPGDAGIGTGEETLFNTMASSLAAGTGIYAEAPVEGILVWNSHAFNVSAEPAKLDIWVNLYFAGAGEQQHLLERFVDVSQITKMRPPAYGADQVCHHKAVPDGAQILDVTSHTHKRGVKFEIFEGLFACSGGPNAGDACTPFGPEPDFPVADLCAGFPCEARLPPPLGDCDGDLSVGIGDLITGVGIALATRPLGACPPFDADGDGRVAIAELVRAVRAALSPALRDAEDSLLYTTLTYADPLVRQFLPPLSLAPRGASPAARTLTYCALYDNGYTDPDEVKRRSTSPSGSSCQPTHCAEGLIGEPCRGAAPIERDRSCDTAAGAGDGFCDACAAGFGVTTDDEMFVLTGSFYVP